MRFSLLGFFLVVGLSLHAGDAVSGVLRAAQEAEARMDSTGALKLYLEADAVRPEDPVILQKIARQYSDLVLDQSTVEEKKRYAQTALDYALRAVALNPRDPVTVLSLAAPKPRSATRAS